MHSSNSKTLTDFPLWPSDGMAIFSQYPIKNVFIAQPPPFLIPTPAVPGATGRLNQSKTIRFDIYIKER